MYIFTDSTKNSNRLISGNHHWNKPLSNTSNNIDFYQLVSKLIQKPSFTEVKNESSWHSLIHTKHSQFSQFDVLTNSVKNDSNLPDGILCHADSGQNFHGQKNRSWKAQEGNIHLSVYLTPNIFPGKINSTFLTMGVSSVIESIDSIPELKGKAMIKWPNDIYIGQSKVGGILTQCFTSEQRVKTVILGIGLNVEVVPEIARDKFTPKAGCLKDCFESVVLSSVFYKLINSLYANYMLVKNNYTKTLHNLYIERSFVMGKNCAFYSMDVNHPDFIGRVSGFGSDLELMFENKTQPIRHGRLEILS